VVAARAQDQGSAGLHGAVLIARRDEPLPSEATDLSNVIPFTRTRRGGEVAVFPLPPIDASERPAPHSAKIWIGVSIACFAASLALHSGLLVMLGHQPRPVASIGVEAMNVEIVLGATTPAGLASTPREQESAPASPSGESVEHEPVTEQSRAATVMPQEVPVAAQEMAPEAIPQEILAEAQTVDPTPQEQRPETAVAEIPVTTQPAEVAEPPRPRVQAVQKAPERKRVQAPTDKKAAQNKERAVTQQTNSARGVGIGRSDKSVNYPGMVRAHLVRYKQAPSGTPGSKGVATIQFLLDGNGRVTSARLVRSSGVPAFDQEIVAMARRASPFPPPPPDAKRDFTVSVNFEVR
jgi:TonB family protein